MDDQPLYNSRIIDTYIRLIKSRYLFVNVEELLDSAGIKPYEVADQGHWFTQAQVDRFHARLARITGNSAIAREAGRYAASPEAMGAMRHYVLSMVGPVKVYEAIRKTTMNFTRSAIYESRRLAANKIEIVVTPMRGVQEKPFQCENRSGFFEAIAMVFHNKLPHMEHTECIFKGGKVCRYVISWERNGQTLLQSLKSYLPAALGALSIASWFAFSYNTFKAVALSSLVSTLLFRLLVAESEKKALRANAEIMKQGSDELLEQINVNYNNALVTNEVGQAISRQTRVDDILTSVVQVLEKRLDFDRGMVLLANDARTELAFRAGFGYPEKLFTLMNETTFHLDRPESQGVFVVCFRQQKPFLVDKLTELEGTLSLRSMEFAKKIGTETFICCPIISDGESLGVLAVDNPKSKRPLMQRDITLLMGIAPMIGISMHNAKLLEAKASQFTSFLKVMAASIDARDPLTAGHSEKVTEYVMGICDELTLPSAEREMIRVAALLHDYGKIGVPDAILKKNGRLTELEYEIVKTHSYKTRDILDQVNFEGIYRQVPEIAGAHHEKVDGTGYPKGLKEKDIPLGAKIIAVADFFEAITSKRHYRDPMLESEAYQLLRDGSGSHFDESIVEALIRYRQRSRQHASLKLVQAR